MNRSVYIFLALFFLLAGCATTHEGEMAQSKEKTLTVSVQKNFGLSDKYYVFYEFTFENMTSDWKQVQVRDIDFEGQETEVLTDDKLSAWIEGAELKLKASQYNQDILLASMVAIGGVTAMTSSSTNMQNTGAATMVGAAAASSGVGIARSRQQAVTGIKGQNNTVNVPQTHAFVPSKVAPESYIKRWIVVRMPAPVHVVGEQETMRQNEFFNRQKLITKVLLDNSKDVEYSTIVVTSSKFKN